MVNKTLTVLASLFLVLMFFTCGAKSFDSKEDLLIYLKDTENGYRFQKSVNGIDYSLMYRPTDLLVIQSVDAEHREEEIFRLRKRYGNYLYFNLSMSANGKELLDQRIGSRAESGAMVNQLSFGMSDKLNLIGEKRDTLPLMDFVYPRMYGMGESTDILLVYKSDAKVLEQEYLLLTIKDLGFGTGEVTFKIEANKIKNQPKLNF
ncbi:hypothetical protein [Flagellimonas beolgyonensis]|uniref:hypothetical protein n=1 Tax=Flagellimonas beolgyonensis TaxID=864064 RepID=UPI003D661E7D